MAALPIDDNGVPTSAQLMDPENPAPGALEWSQYNVVAEGGDVTQGKTTDVAVTAVDATPGTVIGLLKGVISRLVSLLGVGATTLLKREDDAHASQDTGIQVLAVRRDTAAVSSGTTGDYEPLQTDAIGRLRVITKDEVSDATNSTSTGLEIQRAVKASAGKLWGVQGFISTAATGGLYVQIHDEADSIDAADVPKISIPVVAGKAFSLDLGIKGRAFASGIQIGLSSTDVTFTATTAWMFVDAQYE